MYCNNKSVNSSCSNILTSSVICEIPSNICKNYINTDSSGNISVPYPFPAKTLCSWILDVRQYIPYSSKNSVWIKISNTNNVIYNQNNGNLFLFGYYLQSTAGSISNYKGNSITLHWDSEVWLNYNILQITYYSDSVYEDYSGILISWNVDSDSSGLSIESIVAIVTVSIVIFLCFSCCMICCYKCSKVWKSRRIRNNSRRGRIYQVLPDNSLIYLSDENMNSCLPVSKYSKEVLEIGEPICSICFEE